MLRDWKMQSLEGRREICVDVQGLTSSPSVTRYSDYYYI
jgi:hypothetical protein